jgi:tetratricopeptide (TPR) repeat protein
MMGFINPVIQIYSVDLTKDNFDEKEKTTLLNAVKDLKNTSHGLKFSLISFFSKKDPAIQAEYKQFKRNLDMAEKTMAFSPKQSTFYIRSAIGQCASCHSKGGKSTDLFALFKDTKLPAMDKGRLALAIRDYDSSAQIFKSILMDPMLQNNYFRMHDILVSYINSALLGDYEKSKILSDTKSILKITQNKATQKDLQNIIEDIKNSKKMNNFDEALTAFQTFSTDFINFDKSMFSTLNVKNTLHKSLRELKKESQKAQAYEALGDIYSHFPEISIFMVPENYYELCVKTNPKTKLAQDCFRKYKSKIVLGYSGSMGTNVPEYEKKRILELQKLTSM